MENVEIYITDTDNSIGCKTLIESESIIPSNGKFSILTHRNSLNNLLNSEIPAYPSHNTMKEIKSKLSKFSYLNPIFDDIIDNFSEVISIKMDRDSEG
ncbi:hypothetical protein A3Q56_03697 [Intoshia linei]|uniref:Uncharacterized protein n=1 Tax=Intoshia linei TaxID=1819745 RepID=A0A177B371_9BILA|nr:hypothetical protein A3Q56_03697 [Intoshia linei]